MIPCGQRLKFGRGAFYDSIMRLKGDRRKRRPGRKVRRRGGTGGRDPERLHLHAAKAAPGGL
jgi:hypothetical protein